MFEDEDEGTAERSHVVLFSSPFNSSDSVFVEKFFKFSLATVNISSTAKAC